LATASVSSPTGDTQNPVTPTTGRKSRRQSGRRGTSHLKLVPETLALRESLRDRCLEVASKLDKSRPYVKDEIEELALRTLADMGLTEGYLGWTMVALMSGFYADQVAAVPPSRRLFLLPHCLKHAEGCPAEYDTLGLNCEACGACSIADFRGVAEKMGYKVLVAEGSPVVLKIIIGGHVDAIVGVACLNVLEKAFDKLLLAGIPCMSVPLLSSDCRNTSVDEQWVHDMIHVSQLQNQRSLKEQKTRSYLHLMRAASNLFQGETLDSLVTRRRNSGSLESSQSDPIAFTEHLAIDFLSKGGKYSRPFITLAVYDALTGANATKADGADYLDSLSDSVKRAAMSIETFHKASLVHDDIEDDDGHRYGEPTIHRRHGIPTAINVGDYLIGLGYRLVSREAGTLGGEVVAELVDGLADAHMRLSEGQGAELAWRDGENKRLTPLDALKIYALKTSPAFEAALFVGARLAGPVTEYAEPIRQFARNVGVAFQILNDLKDWAGDSDNKMVSGADVLGGRPTVLWALALADLSEQESEELLNLIADDQVSSDRKISRVRQLYHQADVFQKATRLVDKYQARAEDIADSIEPEELRRLFHYLVSTVLERPTENEPQIVITPTMCDLPIVAPHE